MGSVLLLVSVLSCFFFRQALSVSQRLSMWDERRRTLPAMAFRYAVLSIASGLVLMAWSRLWLLVPLGVLALFLATLTLDLELRRKEFTVMGETAGILGLSLAAPAAEYAAAGAFDGRTLGVWALCTVFFVGGLLRVRYRVRMRGECMKALPARWRAGWPVAVFHLMSLAGAALVVSATRFLPPAAPLVLFPSAAYALWTVGRRYDVPAPIRRIGRLELIHAVVFAGLAAAAYGMGPWLQ